MDTGRARRYRQAHRLPPDRWEVALSLILAAVTIVLLATHDWTPA